MHASIHVYPFLSEIPEEILSAIDLDVLYIPSSQEAQVIDVLANELKKNIVIYRKDHHNKGLHLCRVLQPATLSSAQLERLNSVEKHFTQGQVVVAYKKPLKLVG